MTMARLKVHREQNDRRIGRRQPGRQLRCADISGHLPNANVEGKVRMLFLGSAHRVVERRRYVRSSAQRNVARVF
jgi:hypothetical protein